MGPAGSETDLISAQPAIGDGCGNVARLQGTREHLKGLLERQLPLRQFPRASYFGRNDPEQGGAVRDAFSVNGGGFVSLPFRHREGVGDNAGPWLEIEDFRTKLEIDIWQQKHRNHRRRREIAFE